MPSARTATTATVRSSTGGISHALVISHAATPASARALPRDSTPNRTASSSRGRRGRSNSSMDEPSQSHDAIADGQHRCAVADDYHRRAFGGTGADGTQDAVFGLRVE